MVMGATMAKKKGKPKAVVIAVKGSEEYRHWLERGAKYCLIDVSKLVDIAVTQYLRAQGFEEPRPER